MNGTIKRIQDDRKWANLRDSVVVLVAVAAIVAFMFTAYLTIQTNRTVSEINRRQLDAIEYQNDTQLCAQHDIILAVRSIGRKLGLPTGDIPVPDTEGLECAT